MSCLIGPTAPEVTPIACDTKQIEFKFRNVCPEQVVGRPFKFARILRIVRYVNGLQTLASTIMAALPATLQVQHDADLRHPRAARIFVQRRCHTASSPVSRLPFLRTAASLPS